MLSAPLKAVSSVQWQSVSAVATSPPVLLAAGLLLWMYLWASLLEVLSGKRKFPSQKTVATKKGKPLPRTEELDLMPLADLAFALVGASASGVAAAVKFATANEDAAPAAVSEAAAATASKKKRFLFF